MKQQCRLVPWCGDKGDMLHAWEVAVPQQVAQVMVILSMSAY